MSYQRNIPVVLSIAGSDNTGGAGIQADIKTCCAFDVYAATVITGVTAQNSNRIFGVEPVSIEMLNYQIDSIYEVMRPDAVKTGMLPTPEIIEAVAAKLKEYKVTNIVVDPVLVATNGGSLVTAGKDVLHAFRQSLFPLATVVTPNLTEAAEFLGHDVGQFDPNAACCELLECFKSESVLLKGGHSTSGQATDYLYDGNQILEYTTHKISTQNTHGTGCTLSSAIACGLSKGKTLEDSVADAKDYIYKAIESASHIHIMNGPGPLDFMFDKTKN